MPFGLCNAHATFQQCMLAIFVDLVEKSIEVFIDDFFVFGSSFDSFLSKLDTVLKQCMETNLVLNWEKCHFGKDVRKLIHEKNKKVRQKRIALP